MACLVCTRSWTPTPSRTRANASSSSHPGSTDGGGERGHRSEDGQEPEDEEAQHETGCTTDRPVPEDGRMTSVPTVDLPHGRTAQRLEWVHLPPHVRRLVEQRCGTEVVEAQSCTGGFTPGFASVLRGADGSRHYVKAASVGAQRASALTYRGEAAALAALGATGAPLPAPRLLWSHGTEPRQGATGRPDDWVVAGHRARGGPRPAASVARRRPRRRAGGPRRARRLPRRCRCRPDHRGRGPGRLARAAGTGSPRCARTSIPPASPTRTPWPQVSRRRSSATPWCTATSPTTTS